MTVNNNIVTCTEVLKSSNILEYYTKDRVHKMEAESTTNKNW